MADEPTSQAQVTAGVDPARVPPATQAEFGPRPLGSETKKDLDALEASINAQLSGQVQPASPAPAPAVAVQVPQGQATPATAPQAMPAQSAQQGVAVPPGTHVPDKFKLPDGSMDAGKVDAALVNLERYLEKEKELSRRRQGFQQDGTQVPPPAMPVYPYGYPGTVAAPPGYVSPQPGMPPYSWYPPVQQPLETRVNEDLQKDPGATVVNLMRAVSMNAEAQALVQTRDLRAKLELLEIAQSDPGVFTKEGLERLAQVRADNPWLDASPTPWSHAYRLAGPIAPRTGQQATALAQAGAFPAPARTPAPILPGGQSPPASPGTGMPLVTSEAELRRWLQEKSPNNPMKQAELLESLMKDMSRRREGV